MYNHATSDGDGGSNPVQQDPSGSNPLDCLRCNSVSPKFKIIIIFKIFFLIIVIIF